MENSRVAFKRNQEPYKALGIGEYKEFRKGDHLEMLENLCVYWPYGMYEPYALHDGVWMFEDTTESINRANLIVSVKKGGIIRYDGERFYNPARQNTLVTNNLYKLLLEKQDKWKMKIGDK